MTETTPQEIDVLRKAGYKIVHVELRPILKPGEAEHIHNEVVDFLREKP